MVRQLLLLTAAVAASLDQADVSTCGALFSIDGKCQNDSAALLQVAFAPETYPFGKAVRASNDDSDGPVGPAGSKQDLIATKNAVITSMSDWHSSRDLACVDRVQHVTISPRFTMQIFSAVPVFGKNETYIALLADHSGDAWWPEVPLWAQAFDAFVMFCAGPDGSHKTQVIARYQPYSSGHPPTEGPGLRAAKGSEDIHIDEAAKEAILEFQGEYEIARMTNEQLEDHVHQLENEVASRNQVIHDIEMKFTDHLRNYYQNVNSEFNSLSERLNNSTTEAREYHAELMVAAQDDEGSTVRIRDLENKKNLAEDFFSRVYTSVPTQEITT
eukprot:s4560_g4.t1